METGCRNYDLESHNFRSGIQLFSLVTQSQTYPIYCVLRDLIAKYRFVYLLIMSV